MKETREERILRVIEEAKKAGTTMTDEEKKAYEGLKAVDLFNATVSGAIAKLDTFSKLYGMTANLPQETPEEVVKSLATLLEAITREEMNGIADCLLTVVACEPETKVNEQDGGKEQD
jgi:hypothetical protein